MGHTLITRLTDADEKKIRMYMHLAGAAGELKIPFGRGCDRAEADRLIPYHITIMHWGNSEDAVMLERLRNFHFSCSQFIITSPQIRPGRVGSTHLAFWAAPGRGARAMIHELERVMESPVSSDLHMTLAAGKDRKTMEQYLAKIHRCVSFPFTIDTDGLDLFHLWHPVAYVKTFREGIRA